MQLEKKTKTVEAFEGVTLTLSPKEARILMDLVGSVAGYYQGPLRIFTAEVYEELLKALPNALQNTEMPFLENPKADPGYKPKV